MSSIINVGFSLVWEAPVLIQKEGFYTRIISGPREALRYLQKDFEQRSGQLYWNAVYSCTKALRYRSAPEIARQYFIFACGDACIDAK
ncbi:DUF982 domain-containing protein [Rhizobium sp. P40RR-XXII]|uniref:DUF982 domain-containing protein n=1 Tax=unclassified Rhizobium TaxID=2613769 RepID=UPI00145781F8|nr:MULTISPECIES: DUF982 domain-containing protein [unclassified Rhizobium]NLR85352.1 DUF982 domain-containing protein [Rhizobium sp. P28RR-XV]NLS20008.1 DUF982 domain-containing protein [Rhizobium sp. P40RR-XXII]